MALSDVILQTLEPKLTPPSFDMLDLESSGSGNKVRNPELTGYSQQLGKAVPLIRIGSARLSQESIISMEVYQNGLIPTIHVAFMDTTGSFTSINYPKTNPLLTAFVGTTHPKLKSFAQTFLITNIQSIPLTGFMVRYDVYGELYVPKINGNFIRSYNGINSADALKKIAGELGLGFATNDDSTNDKMTWINPNLNYKNFIKQITDRAYKSDKTFFDCFIDRYYVLNFVNVEKQFKRGDTADMGYMATYNGYFETERTENIEKELEKQEAVPIVISNSTQLGAGSELSILSYSLLGDNGDILKIEGYRKRMFTYIHGKNDALKSWFVEPISTLDQPDGQVHQIPDLTDYKENEVVKWVGTDYSNAHANYKFAKLINHHNKLETEKNMLVVNLPGFNQSITRGSRVAVQIFANREKLIDNNIASENYVNDDHNTKDNGAFVSNPEVLDKYLSDSYYVKEISYGYNRDAKGPKFSTKLTLSRRNWFPEPLMKNNNQ